MNVVTFALGLCLILGLSLVVESADNECQAAVKSVTPRHFLDVNKFLGTWYAHKFAVGKPEDVHVPEYKCLSIEYSRKSGNNTLSADETYLAIVNGELKPARATNDVVIGDLKIPAIWTVHSNSSATGEPITTENVVFATNHESYAIQYTCSIRNGKKYEGGSVLTRQRIIGGRLTNILQSLIVGLGFPETQIFSIDQTGCEE